VVLGYIDWMIWVLLFIILFFSLISYFFYVIPKTYKEKLRKLQERQESSKHPSPEIVLSNIETPLI
jgi:hypothetical protein